MDKNTKRWLRWVILLLLLIVVWFFFHSSTLPKAVIDPVQTHKTRRVIVNAPIKDLPVFGGTIGDEIPIFFSFTPFTPFVDKIEDKVISDIE